ncbi:unnamed protein product [Cunninghamella blakesleeana]
MHLFLGRSVLGSALAETYNECILRKLDEAIEEVNAYYPDSSSCSEKYKSAILIGMPNNDSTLEEKFAKLVEASNNGLKELNSCMEELQFNDEAVLHASGLYQSTIINAHQECPLV